MPDILDVFGVRYTGVEGIKATDSNNVVQTYVRPNGTINIVENGTVDVSQYASAVVNVSSGETVNNQNKSVTPTESQQQITADLGYTGLGTVTVGAISSEYVGSGVARKSSSDLTASGNTVTAPAGYYSSDATKTISSVTHTNPTVAIDGTTGLITATHTQSAGYISAGTTTGTQQLTTKAATTITPTTSSQQAVAANVYTLGAITVGPIPSNYITTNDATASAADILSGATAYVDGSKLTGTLTIQHVYSGSSAPSSGTGSNGDIYIQTS